MSEIIEEAQIVAKPVKRTVKQFLNQYRSLGLPGAKRFKRRTRLAQAEHQHQVDIAMMESLLNAGRKFLKALTELEKEENWAVKGEDIVWIGEGDPLEIIKNAKS